MGKVAYTLYYEVDQYWGVQRDLIGIYTNKKQMLMNVDTHLQNLINQVDTNLCGYSVSDKENKKELRVTTNRGKTHLHRFRWKKTETNTMDSERVCLSYMIPKGE